MESIVEAEGLTKRFGEVEALAGLDLVVPAGKVLALLGPNGAGKTTFVRTIATLTRPDSGTLRVAGIDVVRQPGRVRRVIGLAGQHAAVEPAMSGRENLRMVARLFGHGRRESGAAAAAVLDQLDLVETGDRLVRTYSGGMRRRLDLGASLVAPRASCSSTSPPPAWTHGAATSCGGRSRRLRRRAPTSCSRPSTSTRPTAWPTTSRSSTVGGSWPWAPPTS